MANKNFKVPFQFCKLDRAIRLLNQFTDIQLEVEDLLSFAIAHNIKLHVYLNHVVLQDFSLSHEKIVKLHEGFENKIFGSFTHFKLGNSYEEKSLIMDFKFFNAGKDVPQDKSKIDVLAFAKGFWVINEWDLRPIYFGEQNSTTTQIYAIDSLLMKEPTDIKIRLEHSLGIEQMIIFDSEILKVFEHLTGKNVFANKDAEDDQVNFVREAKQFENEQRVNERVTGTVAELIYGLLQLVYKYDDPMLNQSTRLYTDLHKKFLKNEPTIDANIMSQRAFEELMQKVYIQRDKPRG
ncbi:hypothetical protein ORI99_09390 [Alishewanella sp. SMS9]|nr:hypothetical protein [Alishewanella sp. SMS9]